MNVSAKCLHERLASKIQAGRDILDLAKTQGRELTTEEIATVANLHLEARNI